MEDVKNFFEILAILFAGGFFGYKLYSGYFIVDLSLDLESVRNTYDSKNDIVVVKLKLKKGERGTLQVHDAQVKYTYRTIPPNDPNSVKFVENSVKFVGVERQSFKKEIIPNSLNIERKVIKWEKRSKSVPLLSFSAGEETTFSCYFIVPKDKVCEIDSAILGKKTGHKKTSQWRASCISI